MATSQHQPLKGLLVIAIEQAVAAPTCTCRLADAGARVIKIEREEGETARHYDKTVHGTSAYFAWLNRGKQSIVLNLKNPEDQSFARNLINQADVFVQNLAPGAIDRMGLSYDALQETNSKLIMASIVGYGQDTSYSDMRAYDLLVQAESGVCSVTGSRDEPAKVGVSISDISTGMNAHAAVLEALIERGLTGKGRHIEMPMFDGLADWMNVPLLHYDYGKQETARHGMGHASVYPYRPYKCADGEIVIVVQNPGEWARLCERVLEKSNLIADQRFHDNPSRLINRDALDDEISSVFQRLSRDELIQRLESANLAWGAVSSVENLSSHQALRRISAFTKDKLFELAAPPLHPELESRKVPELGEHTAAIREEFGTL